MLKYLNKNRALLYNVEYLNKYRALLYNVRMKTNTEHYCIMFEYLNKYRAKMCNVRIFKQIQIIIVYC